MTRVRIKIISLSVANTDKLINIDSELVTTHEGAHNRVLNFFFMESMGEKILIDRCARS